MAQLEADSVRQEAAAVTPAERGRVYREALDVEGAGYAKLLADAERDGDEAGVKLYSRLVDEVAAEKQRSLEEDRAPAVASRKRGSK